MEIQHVRASEIDTTTMPTLDVRTKPGKEQIRGALRYDPKALLGVERLALPFPHDGRIIVYGDDEKEGAQIAARLHQQGYTNAAVLEGGFNAYRNAGLPVEEITQDQPVPGRDDAGIHRY
jgi:rhodanese-related sulfurtransferase